VKEIDMNVLRRLNINPMKEIAKLMKDLYLVRTKIDKLENIEIQLSDILIKKYKSRNEAKKLMVFILENIFLPIIFLMEYMQNLI